MYPDMNQADLLSCKKKPRISILINIHEGELATRKILAIDNWKKWKNLGRHHSRRARSAALSGLKGCLSSVTLRCAWSATKWTLMSLWQGFFYLTTAAEPLSQFWQATFKISTRDQYLWKGWTVLKNARVTVCTKMICTTAQRNVNVRMYLKLRKWSRSGLKI